MLATLLLKMWKLRIRNVKWLFQEHSAGEWHVNPKSPDSKLSDLPRTPQPLLNESRHSLFSLYPTPPTKAKGGGLSLSWLQRQGVGGRQGPWEAAFPMQQLQGSFYPRPDVLCIPRDQHKKRNLSSNSLPAQVAVPNPPLLPTYPTSLSSIASLLRHPALLQQVADKTQPKSF